MDKVIKKSEEVVGITEEHEKINLDFILTKNISSSLTIRLIQWQSVVIILVDG